MLSNKQLHHGLFLVLLAGFIISKCMHLDIPYFWDESWVYAPAVNVMADLGPTLIPGSFPLEHSRGHPLLFHFLGGIWIKIFGNSLMALHAFGLTISIIFIVSIYKLVCLLINNTVALVTIALLIFQPIFYAQSSMVLPEILLAFFCFLSLCFCYRELWVLYFISASLAVWTKESAIAFIGCLFGAALFTSLKNKSFKSLNLVLILSPLLSFLLFIAANKLSYGWYLYPEHTGMLTFEFNPFWGKLKALFLNLLSDQKRWPLSIVASIACIILAVKNHKFYTHDFFIFLVIPILGYSIFCALNFYTVRYILTILPLAIIMMAWLIVEVIKSKQVWLGILTAGFLIHSIIQLFDKRSVRDIDLSYLDYGPAQLEIVEYMEQNQLFNASIHTTFLVGTGLTQKYGGYRNTEPKFTKVNQEMSLEKNYFIFSKLEPHHHRDKVINHPEAKLLKSINKGNVAFEIYLLEGSL